MISRFCNTFRVSCKSFHTSETYLTISTRGKYNRVTNETRALIIKCYERSEPIRSICDHFEVKEGTFRSIIRCFLLENRREKKNKGHRQKILKPEQVTELLSMINEDCELTLSELKEKFSEKFGFTVSESTIHRSLGDFHYSLKRLSPVPIARNSPENLLKRQDYAISYDDVMSEREKIFFLDEFGISLSYRRGFGRSEIGSRANCQVRCIRSKNYSVSAAINSESLYFFEMSSNPYNAEDYGIFLNKFFDYLRRDSIVGAVLIMDNVRFHKTLDVQQLMMQMGINVYSSRPTHLFSTRLRTCFINGRV